MAVLSADNHDMDLTRMGMLTGLAVGLHNVVGVLWLLLLRWVSLLLCRTAETGVRCAHLPDLRPSSL
jgi:hypothetical protein